MINFSDLNFIFRFLPVFLIVFYITPPKFRTWVLLSGSLVFYALGDLKMVPALVVTVIVNFLFAKALMSEKSRSLFIFILCIDVLMLVEFKLLSRFVDVSLMPIGISFYTFKMISFQADIYRGRIDKEVSFKDAATYFCMFPQIVSGPIMRYEDYEKNVLLAVTEEGEKSVRSVLRRLEDGLLFFIMGLAFKVLLADHLSMLWNGIGTIGYESISTPLAWLGVAAYSLELYFDFWGYSLMAAGIGIMLGFPFIRNFDHPYGASGVAEFYRKWHASLGSWFRDYIYIPLGGSRKGNFRTGINLLIVWLITGFWHGTNLNFLIWGFALFLIILCEKFFIPKKALKVIGRFNVFVLIPLTWVIFALPDTTMLQDYFCRLFPFFGEGVAVNRNDVIKNLSLYWMYLVPSVLLLIPRVYDFWENNRRHVIFAVLSFLLFWACVFSLSNAAGNPFMYIRF